MPPEPQKPAPDATEADEKPIVHESIAAALLAVQTELPKVPKKGVNPHFKSKYAELDDIMDLVKPVLCRHGIVWTAAPGYAHHEGRYEATLNYSLLHADSKSERGGHMLLLSAKDDPQGQGAGISYACRQAITAVLGITAEDDDDGNRAANARQESQQRQAEARAGARILSDEQRASMLNQVRESGLDIAETMAQCGIDPDGDVTAAQSRQVRALIEAAKPAGES